MKCPSCALDLGEHYRDAIGVEVRGVYDGVLFWTCPSCEFAWPAFTGERWGRRAVKAQRCADEWNAAHQVATQ